MLSDDGDEFFRGATLRFATQFYDYDGVEVQPAAADVVIVYSTPSAGPQTVTVPMTPPSGAQLKWTATWDSRGATPGSVQWSIHSDPPTPVSVEDGLLTLKANAATPLTF